MSTANTANTANTTTTAPDTNAREFIAGLKYRYHHYEHACEGVETEIREILAGRRQGTLRLRNLIARRDESLEALKLYLTTLTARIKNGDERLAQLLHDKFGALNENVHRPLVTEE